MPRLAIVVSAVGSIESMEATLVSVLEHRPADCEIIVALQRPYADPYDLKDEVQFLPPGRRRSVMSAINHALAATRAPFVHVLAAGCQVSEGWADEALGRFGDRQVAAVVPMIWNANDSQQILAAGVSYRKRGQRYLVGQGRQSIDSATQAAMIAPASMAGFYRKAALDFVGGFSDRLGPRQADADLGIVFRKAGLGVVLEARSQVFATPEADVSIGSMGEALANERLFWRNFVAPGRVTGLMAHAMHVAYETVASFGRPRMVTQAMARMWACCEAKGHARHRLALAELAARAIRPAAAVETKLTNDNVRIDRSHDSLTRSDAARTRAHAS